MSVLQSPCSNLSGLSSEGETLLEAPYCNRSHRWMVGSSLLHHVLESVSSFSGWGVSVQSCSLSGWDFVLHAPCWNLFVGLGVSLTCPFLESIRPLVGWGLSLKQPVMESVLSYIGRKDYLTPPVLTSVSSFVRRRVSLTRPVLQSVSPLRGPGVSLTHSVLESILSFVGRGVSLTSPVLVCVSSSVGGEFLLHAP